MPSLLDDPLYKSMYDTGQGLLNDWNPAAEALRKDQSWGSAKQKLAERYSRAGLTGSSDELGAVSNAAQNFELDWLEREPAYKRQAIASVLPITNFMKDAYSQEASLSGTNPYTGTETFEAKRWREAQDTAKEIAKQQQGNADAQLIGNVLGSLGIPQWLANELFGINTSGGAGGAGGGGAATGLVNTGLKYLWNELTGGSGAGSVPLSTDTLNALDPAIDWTDAQSWVDDWIANNIGDTTTGGTDFLAGGGTGSGSESGAGVGLEGVEGSTTSPTNTAAIDDLAALSGGTIPTVAPAAGSIEALAAESPFLYGAGAAPGEIAPGALAGAAGGIATIAPAVGSLEALAATSPFLYGAGAAGGEIAAGAGAGALAAEGALGAGTAASLAPLGALAIPIVVGLAARMIDTKTAPDKMEPAIQRFAQYYAEDPTRIAETLKRMEAVDPLTLLTNPDNPDGLYDYYPGASAAIHPEWKHDTTDAVFINTLGRMGQQGMYPQYDLTKAVTDYLGKIEAAKQAAFTQAKQQFASFDPPPDTRPDWLKAQMGSDESSFAPGDPAGLQNLLASDWTLQRIYQTLFPQEHDT